MTPARAFRWMFRLWVRFCVTVRDEAPRTADEIADWSIR